MDEVMLMNVKNGSWMKKLNFHGIKFIHAIMLVRRDIHGYHSLTIMNPNILVEQRKKNWFFYRG
jgi:hypothetical protein